MRYTSAVVLRFLRRRWPVYGLVLLACGCKVGGFVANVLGDVVGETADVSCDRRYISNPAKKPATFCQEVIDTVAVSEVKDDCRKKFAARTSESKCPRDKIIAGCKIHKDNDDGSEVFDWYYDVTDLEDAAAQDAGSDAAPLFEDPARTKEDVKALCADSKRYEEGATYKESP